VASTDKDSALSQHVIPDGYFTPSSSWCFAWVSVRRSAGGRSALYDVMCGGLSEEEWGEGALEMVEGGEGARDWYGVRLHDWPRKRVKIPCEPGLGERVFLGGTIWGV